MERQGGKDSSNGENGERTKLGFHTGRLSTRDISAIKWKPNFPFFFLKRQSRMVEDVEMLESGNGLNIHADLRLGLRNEVGSIYSGA